MDIAIVATLALAFGLLVTAHLGLSLALLWRPRRWRAVVALLLPPLAPYWGWQAGYAIGSIVWIAAFCLYAIARILASR